MMPARTLVRLVMSNTLRSPRHFILSAFGIVIGIGAFVLFLALTQRAGGVLEKVFPLDEVQVVAPRVSLLGKDASKKLDDATVKQILARPEVATAIPRMNLSFPAAGQPDDTSLGDIILAYETCAEEASDRGIALSDHACHLALHGVLHLLGQDHETEAEAEAMEGLETRFLGAIGIADPHNGELIDDEDHGD